MKALPLFLLVTILFSLLELSAVSPGDRRPNQPRSSSDSGKDYLFPGTGFFRKNRSPIEGEQAKRWFLEAESEQKTGDLKSALDLYENFAKRRSDSVLIRNKVEIQVGPESLYRAAIIREKKGDWQESFKHLKLIAEAYTDYNFERVAESLMRIAEKLAKDKLPRKWGFVPRIRSGNQDRIRLGQIAGLARGPKFAPRALMALAEIAAKDKKEDEAIDALERLVNLYPENYLCEEAYFLLAKIYETRVSGPAYDQGATLKALNFYEDYVILYSKSPPRSKHEQEDDYRIRLKEAEVRRSLAEKGRRKMRETLAASKVVLGQFVEKYGRYYMVRWQELGNKPALQFYNEAITTAPESNAARVAEKKVAELRAGDD
jgi:outer membrane protein assembly factor BamD